MIGFIILACAGSGWCQEARVSPALLLDSVLVDSSNPSFDRIKFTLEDPQAAGFAFLAEQESLATKAVEFFFIGLSIPQEKLWVNLNPNEPGKIIDPSLRDTDLGKIILAADLRLKKDIAGITNPRTSKAGRLYWDKLYAKAQELGLEDKIPVANRVWIIPDVSQVRESEKEIKIINSPLKICLESEYLGRGSETKSPKQKELADYANRLLKELILPILAQKVNEQGGYSDLRGVYQALLLARWYKNNSSGGEEQFLKRAAATVWEDTSSGLTFRAENIYSEYLRSLKKGEYNFSESKEGQLDFYLSVITRDYFSGGVDFRPMKTVNSQAPTIKPSGKFYTAEISLPKNYGRILRFVKSKLELKVEEPSEVSPNALVENLPGLTSGQIKQPSLLAQEKFSRAVLSNL